MEHDYQEGDQAIIAFNAEPPSTNAIADFIEESGARVKDVGRPIQQQVAEVS